MKAKELEKKFDKGEDITKNLDVSKARRLGLEQKKAEEAQKKLRDETAKWHSYDEVFEDNSKLIKRLKRGSSQAKARKGSFVK